jgi:predicted TIM-barrel fold metal-dependent hydrolase
MEGGAVGVQSSLPYKAIDFDNHYYEQDDCFTRHIEPKFKEQAIRPVKLDDGTRPWMLGDHIVSFFPANAADSIARPGFMEHQLTGEAPLSWTEESLISAWDHPEMIHRTERLAALQQQGLEAVVMVPTAGLGIEWEYRGQVPALCANLRSFNRWIEEEWGYGRDGRIFGVPMMTLLDLDWAIDELQRVADLGCRLVFLKVGPIEDRSPADPVFDPWWARVQEIGVLPIFHVGSGGFPEMYAAHWGEDPNRSVMEFSAVQYYLCNGERPIEDTMAAVLLHNLFGRFPDLKAVSLENGSSWVRPLLKGVDKAANLASSGPWLGGKLAERPSEVFRRHVYVAPYFEDDIDGLVELIGAEHVLFGSDWPHPEGVPEPLDFVKYLSAMSDKQLRTIMRGNAAGLLGLAE